MRGSEIPTGDILSPVGAGQDFFDMSIRDRVRACYLFAAC
jgi:hypothetical protein